MFHSLSTIITDWYAVRLIGMHEEYFSFHYKPYRRTMTSSPILKQTVQYTGLKFIPDNT